MLAHIFGFVAPFWDSVTPEFGVARLFLGQDAIVHIQNALQPYLSPFWIYYVVAGVAAVITLSLLWMAKPKRRPTAIQAAAASPEEIDLDQIYHRYRVSDTQPRAVVSSFKVAGVSNGLTTASLERLDSPGDKIPIDRKFVRIGRHSTNDIVLPDSSVHRYHAVLAQNENAQFVLTDLGGSNGCLVNGVRSQNKIVENGDIVALGEVRLKFHDRTKKT